MQSAYFAYTIVSFVIYFSILLICLISTIVFFCGSKTREATQKQAILYRFFSLGRIALFALLRCIDSLLHIGGWYISSPDLLRHLLFILPLTCLFSAYFSTVISWHSIVLQLKGDICKKRSSLMVTEIIFNIAVLALTATSIILHQTILDSNRLRVIGATNLALCLLSLIALVYYIVTASAFLVLLHRHQRNFTHMVGKYRPLFVKILFVSVCSSLGFLAFTALFTYEGIHLVIHGFFLVFQHGYTTTPALLFTHLIATILPPCALMVCYTRIETLCEKKRTAASLKGRHPRGCKPPPQALSSGDEQENEHASPQREVGTEDTVNPLASSRGENEMSRV
eukprot:gnl/Trimastix_PCT/2531.p1 GENE.gnl/Trimastix_PCT/2531~~gnl/Trimastix_PCT/2531.p1  ORF type:complete len:339 (+),score=37.75 gnl/Trimastix_PCT/2531:77-1093(+)